MRKERFILEIIEWRDRYLYIDEIEFRSIAEAREYVVRRVTGRNVHIKIFDKHGHLVFSEVINEHHRHHHHHHHYPPYP